MCAKAFFGYVYLFVHELQSKERDDKSGITSTKKSH
jgi:hypothetical protein